MLLIGQENKKQKLRKKTKEEKALEVKSANSAIHDMLRVQGKSRDSQYEAPADFGRDSYYKQLPRNFSTEGEDHFG